MSKKDRSIGLGLSDLFKGLGDLLEVAQKLDTKGINELKQSGTFGSTHPKGLRGAYGFSVRVGGASGSTIRSFGNLKPNAGKIEFNETWEPILDVFDEGDYVLVIAELPGVDKEQLQLKLEGKVLHLKANGIRQYEKDIILPYAVKENIISVFQNGIVEITLYKN